MPSYTANWFPATTFAQYFTHLKGRKGLRFLEIGLLEGQGSRYFFENYLGKTGTLVGIDPFIDYSKASVAKIQGFDDVINESLEQRFKENTAEFADRITLHKGLSQDVLPGLGSNSFDVAFIDGDHSRDAVAFDGKECWRLVKKGGYIVFDDYLWGYKDKPETSPKDAIDQFLKEHETDINIVHQAWCVIVKKKGKP
jgi:predicted O-methyltransferase YrrM